MLSWRASVPRQNCNVHTHHVHVHQSLDRLLLRSRHRQEALARMVPETDKHECQMQVSLKNLSIVCMHAPGKTVKEEGRGL